MTNGILQKCTTILQKYYDQESSRKVFKFWYENKSVNSSPKKNLKEIKIEKNVFYLFIKNKNLSDTDEILLLQVFWIFKAIDHNKGIVFKKWYSSSNAF